MIGAASPVCQRGMDGTEPTWTTNFACCVTWPPVAKPGTGICRDVHTCATSVPERTENCGRQRSHKGVKGH